MFSAPRSSAGFSGATRFWGEVRKGGEAPLRAIVAALAVQFDSPAPKAVVSVRFCRDTERTFRVTASDADKQAIRIAVVDDHTLFREGVRLILELEQDLSFVGEAASVEDALALIDSARPDLVLLDLRLAEARGLDLLPRLVTTSPAPKVLIVTAFPDEPVIADAIRLGAKGVVPKDATRETLLSAIRTVGAGRLWLPPDLSARVITALTHSTPSSLGERLGTLTARERDIVVLVGEGLKNREIAQRLAVAEKTIKGHLTNIFLKLGVPDRLALALLAIKTHLASPREF
ncbi:MAG: DNA-binding response regulator [Candidatus Rokuibacteriota bacterium]|nr:MAG: DNA-binding response regulator [Candidatus Rokubacteria bacterium]